MKKLYIVQTVTNLENSKALIDIALNLGFSPCVQSSEILSKYFWNNEIVEDNEVLLTFKVSKKNLKHLIKTIKSNHTYETPEIIYTNIKVTKKYKEWYKKSVKALKRAFI